MSEADVAEITLEGSLDISNAQELHDRLRAALETGAKIMISATGVERADTTAVQLLCALTKKMHSESREVIWQDPSDALQNAIRILGANSCITFPGQA